MSNLTPVATFDDVFQLETATIAIAGPGGIANAQAQALANRTEYLRQTKGTFTENTTHTKLGASFSEYWNTHPDNGNVKCSIGMLGNPEANVSVNMDYTNNVHKYYDSSRAATWFALGPDNYAIQHAATGAPADVDCWYATGAKYLWGGTADGRMFVNSFLGEDFGDAQLFITAAAGKASIGGKGDLKIEGDRKFGVAGPVYLNAYNAGPVILNAGGGMTKIGNISAPLNTLDVVTASATGANGSDGISVNDGQSQRVGINFGVNTTGQYGWIQSSKGGVGLKNIAIQPLGGAASIGTSTFTPSAVFEIQSTTQGFLPPRMTTAQKNAITSPAEGLQIYDSTLKKMCFFNGTAWQTITSA